MPVSKKEGWRRGKNDLLLHKPVEIENSVHLDRTSRETSL